MVAPAHSYTGTLLQLADLEARGRIRTALVDITDTAAVAAACEDAALVWFESPTNPALELADIAAIAAAAHEAGAYVVVDNTFATPLLQRPLDARRRHRRALGDQVPRRPQRRADGRDRHRRRRALRRAQGPPRPDRRDPRDRSRPGWPCAACAPCTCASSGPRPTPPSWPAGWREHPAISEVRYPGFGGIVSIVLAEGADGRRPAVPHATRLWVHATSLGGVESTLERRRRWKAEPVTIPDGLVRLSVGIEDVEDLWADLDGALRLAGAPRLSARLPSRLGLSPSSRPWCRGR